MLSERQKAFKKDLEIEIYQAKQLLEEAEKRGYSTSITRMLRASIILKRETLDDINRYDR